MAVDDPLDEPDLTALCLQLVSRGQVMGFLPRDPAPETRLDLAFIGRIGDCLAATGVAQESALALVRAAEPARWDARRVGEELRRTIDAVDASPQPDGEWGPARDLLGDDLLARLLAISSSSLRRYASRERPTPDEVAWRLHSVSRVLAALIGSYNSYGVRRWFDRERVALDGRAPAELIAGAEAEDDAGIVAVIALAESLAGASSAE